MLARQLQAQEDAAAVSLYGQRSRGGAPSRQRQQGPRSRHHHTPYEQHSAWGVPEAQMHSHLRPGWTSPQMHPWDLAAQNGHFTPPIPPEPPFMLLRGGVNGRHAGAIEQVIGQLMGNHNGHPMPFAFPSEEDLSQHGMHPESINANTTTMRYGDGPSTASNSRPRSADSTSARPADAAENRCAVCLDQFGSGDQLRVLPCMHRYHRACIDQWLVRSPACPVCKHVVGPS